jgi:predicted RNase H-like nuclease
MRKGKHVGEIPEMGPHLTPSPLSLRGEGEPELAAERKAVAGVDGCTAGWLYVLAESPEPGRLLFVAIGLAADFPALLDATAACDAVAVDVPIGLSSDGRRSADYAARRCLGPRRSSVFPPPARALLSMEGGFWELNAASKAIRAGISQQTYNILGKIRDADRAMTPALQSRVTESHPEVTFWALNGGSPLAHNKKRPEGRAQRLALLQGVFGNSADILSPPRGAGWDDLYDAAALAWTASRVAYGVERRLPELPELDARGLRMEIVY